jgi:putative tryptophan/tyrosine transport system substrate-binding protein
MKAKLLLHTPAVAGVGHEATGNSKKAKVWGFALCALLFALCLQVEAQQPHKLHRIGLLQSASSEATFIDAFRQGLRDLGYVEGKNLVLEIRWGEAKPERISKLAAELVRLNVDVIVAVGSFAVRATKEATTTIPIVMRTGSDPVQAGFVPSLARPGGNITGVTSITTELIGKRLELLAEVVPDVKRIAALTAATQLDSWLASDQYKEMEAAARALGVKLQILSARDSKAIDSAFSAMAKERAQGVNVIPSPRFNQFREHILKHAAKNHLPAIYFQSVYVESGGLMSYSADTADEYRRSAVYVDKILKGAKPADLPVEQAVKYELVINLKTAKQIGLTIPPNVLARADRVIR